MARVFVALTFPDAVCDALARDVRSLARYDRLARFTSSTDLHMTLAFLGEVNRTDAQRLSAALRPLARLTPRELSLGRLGLFERSRVLWAGVTPAESLQPVADAVRETITTLGLSYDRKPFKAHITVARNWRRPLPYVDLPARSFTLQGPVLLESAQDPRTGLVRYRQIF